ncbi:MAG TPA: Rrf2 family transcriptional regulator [Gemmatales bacterium]|nr:Rrf2 family transcriptional regulator [Gemmatales bacterium]
MISQTVEYALRATVYLARHMPQAQTTDEIAKVTQVPRPYLAKVLQGLNRAGIVQSQRGLGGGIALTRKASELTILQIVNAVEPFQRIHKCPLKLSSHGMRLCSLHQRLDDALSAVEKAFSQSTLAEILDEPNDGPPLCEANAQLKVKRRTASKA